MKLTAHDDINELLSTLSMGLRNILGSDLVAVYLTGSLTYGDFDRESSDIDFLVIMKNSLEADRLLNVQNLHEEINQEFPFWKTRLEGSYITDQMLESTKPPQEKRPYVNAGKMWQFVYGNEWIINLYALYACGRSIYGPDPHEIMKPVHIEEVRQASRYDLIEEWLPKVDNPQAFQEPGYDSSHLQAYAILTLCRILYREFHDDVSSKRVATIWVKKKYPQWNKLVSRAEKWQHGDLLTQGDAAKKFIQFVCAQTS